MNRYDEFFDFRLATKDDVDAIMKFIRDNWSENHILAKDKDFFLWQYGNDEYEDLNTVNFVLMLDKEGHIVGTNGFNKYSDKEDELYVSSSITKVKADLQLPLCGVELIKRFHELVPAKAYYSGGTNPKTMMPIGKRVFHYDTGHMQQFYLVNPSVKEYKIAGIKNEKKLEYEKTECVLEEISNVQDLKARFDSEKRYPHQAYKTLNYLNKRFFEHPIYRYKAWGIKKESGAKVYEGVLFGREISLNGTTILRFVDYVGDIEYLGKIGCALQTFFAEKKYEYIDFLLVGLDVSLMEKSGFSLLEEEDENIIPTYFEPFLRENVKIHYQRSDADIILYKADGDQDRPNKRQ